MKMSLSRSMCGSALVVAVGMALLLSAGCQQSTISGTTYQATASPRLVELGTAACIPCALMRPGLNELKEEYAGRLEVEVIDTLIHPGAKSEYNAPFCATQIYIAASGKELYRHVGYASKQDILANWKTMGVNLDAGAVKTKAKTKSKTKGAVSPR